MSLRPWLLALCLASTMAACVRVKPYQRETHAQPIMQDRDRAEQKLETHVHDIAKALLHGRLGCRGAHWVAEPGSAGALATCSFN